MESTRSQHCPALAEMKRPFQKIIYAILVNKVDRVIESEYETYESSMHAQLKEWCEIKQKQFNLNRAISIHFVSAKTGHGVE